MLLARADEAPVSAAARNVRLWHKADIGTVLNDVRFWG
jgi:hypothetical protein